MIDLGRPALHGEGLTVLADHADDALFHYLPDAPALRTGADGVPEVGLLEYRLPEATTGVLGQGLLSFTVDLGVDDARLARLRDRLAARTGRSGLRLAPVAAESGRADLTLLGRSTVGPHVPTDAGDAADALVVRPLVVAAPMLVGDKAATFMAVLSAEGATLVESAMRRGGLPAAVAYTLRVTGLRPALRARITARWSDVFGYYEIRLLGGKLLLATDIGETVEDLVRSEAITVEIDDLVPAAERSEVDRRAVDEVQRYVVQELFVPTLGQAPPAPDAEAEGLAAVGTAIKDVFGVFALTYTLRDVDRRELKTLRYDLATARAEALVLSPQGTLVSALTGVDVGPLVRVVEPSASPEMVFDVGVVRDLAAEQVERVEVAVRYGDDRHDVVLDAATPRRPVTVWHDPARGPGVDWGYTVHFVPASGDVDVLEGPARRTDERILRIDPRELYRRLRTRVIAQGIPFDRYPRTLVDLRYTVAATGWTADVPLELDADHRESTAEVRVTADHPVLVRRRVRYVEVSGEVLTLDWDTAGLDGLRDDVLVVGDPLPDVVDVQLLGSARFGTVVARLVVELRPRSEPTRVDTRVLTAEAPVATWSWSVGGSADRGYDYRVTVHTTAGELREGDWRPGEPGKLVVGEGFAALRQVTLHLVGGTFASRGLLAVTVRFESLDDAGTVVAEHEVLLTDAAQPVVWAYPVPTGSRPRVAVRLTGVGMDGRSHPQPPLTTSDLLVVAPLPDPTTVTEPAPPPG